MGSSRLLTYTFYAIGAIASAAGGVAALGRRRAWFAVFAAAACCGCTSMPTEADVRPLLEKSMAEWNANRFDTYAKVPICTRRLLSVKKVDGASGELLGRRTYTLAFIAEEDFAEDCYIYPYFGGGARFLRAKPAGWRAPAQFVPKGQARQHRGSWSFSRRESGWRPEMFVSYDSPADALSGRSTANPLPARPGAVGPALSAPTDFDASSAIVLALAGVTLVLQFRRDWKRAGRRLQVAVALLALASVIPLPASVRLALELRDALRTQAGAGADADAVMWSLLALMLLIFGGWTVLVSKLLPHRNWARTAVSVLVVIVMGVQGVGLLRGDPRIFGTSTIAQLAAEAVALVVLFSGATRLAFGSAKPVEIPAAPDPAEVGAQPSSATPPPAVASSATESPARPAHGASQKDLPDAGAAPAPVAARAEVERGHAKRRRVAAAVGGAITLVLIGFVIRSLLRRTAVEDAVPSAAPSISREPTSEPSVPAPTDQAVTPEPAAPATARAAARPAQNLGRATEQPQVEQNRPLEQLKGAKDEAARRALQERLAKERAAKREARPTPGCYCTPGDPLCSCAGGPGRTAGSRGPHGASTAARSTPTTPIAPPALWIARDSARVKLRPPEPNWIMGNRDSWTVLTSFGGKAIFAVTTFRQPVDMATFPTNSARFIGITDPIWKPAVRTKLGENQLDALTAEGACTFQGPGGHVWYAIVDGGGAEQLLVIYALAAGASPFEKDTALAAVRTLARP